MPLYKRLPFQRRLMERRSLRIPTTQTLKSQLGFGCRGSAVINDPPIAEEEPGGGGGKPGKCGKGTQIDLELDLAAQQSKLKLLQDEIDRLRSIKSKLEEARAKGDKDIPNWFLEEERFQSMLSKVSIFGPENPLVLTIFVRPVSERPKRQKVQRGKEGRENDS